jgi:hypothetical protein
LSVLPRQGGLRDDGLRSGPLSAGPGLRVGFLALVSMLVTSMGGPSIFGEPGAE